MFKMAQQMNYKPLNREFGREKPEVQFVDALINRKVAVS
jgi:hypothetical protein